MVWSKKVIKTTYACSWLRVRNCVSSKVFTKDQIIMFCRSDVTLEEVTKCGLMLITLWLRQCRYGYRASLPGWRPGRRRWYRLWQRAFVIITNSSSTTCCFESTLTSIMTHLIWYRFLFKKEDSITRSSFCYLIFALAPTCYSDCIKTFQTFTPLLVVCAWLYSLRLA